jgi:tetratricopeptide (TPR) repeat protein
MFLPFTAEITEDPISVGAYDPTIHELCAEALIDFKLSLSFFDRWLFAFTALIAVEVLFALGLATSPLLLGICLSAVFISIFVFYVLIRFFEEKKADKLQESHGAFSKALGETFSQIEKGDAQKKLLCYSHIKLCDKLEDFERHFLLQQFLPKSLAHTLSKWSVGVHAPDILLLRLALLEKSALGLIEIIQKKPLDLDVHLRLSQLYLKRAQLILKAHEHKERIGIGMFGWGNLDLDAMYTQSLKHALQELTVVESIDPTSIWVHAQMIECYGALGEEEMQIEKAGHILKLGERSPTALLSIGQLYFRKGLHKEGLSIYEKLLQIDPTKAQELIKEYSTPLTNAL